MTGRLSSRTRYASSAVGAARDVMASVEICKAGTRFENQAAPGESDTYGLRRDRDDELDDKFLFICALAQPFVLFGGRLLRGALGLGKLDGSGGRGHEMSPFAWEKEGNRGKLDHSAGRRVSANLWS